MIADSDRLRIEESEIYGNTDSGGSLMTSNDDAVLSGNRVHDNKSYGIFVVSARVTVYGGEVYSNSTGIFVNGAGSLVEGVVVYGNSTGIYSVGGTSRVQDNVVH